MQEVMNKLRYTAVVNDSMEIFLENGLLFGKLEILKQTEICWGMKYQEGHTYKNTFSYWNQWEVLEILRVLKVPLPVWLSG